MDRVAPTRRPEGRPIGWQSWRDLLFVHWPMPVDALRPLVPEPLALDTHAGVAWVGVVPFLMQGVRPWRWWPKSLGFEFLECNLRTYVHLDGADPGVWFFSLEAASWLAVHAARIGWSLPYHHARMRSAQTDGRFDYLTERRSDGARFAARWTVGDARPPADPASLEFFLFERYFLYSARRGRLKRGQVHHPPYPVRAAHIERCEESLIAAAGLPAPHGAPPLSHFSAGVDVDIFALIDTGRAVSRSRAARPSPGAAAGARQSRADGT